MKNIFRRAKDTPVSSFLSAIDLCNNKLARFAGDLSDEELNWIPSGVRNSILWILVHLTAELWCCHAALTGVRLPFNPAAAGVAGGSISGLEYDKDSRLPLPSKTDPGRHLHEALEALRTVLEGTESGWEQREIYADAKMRTAWYYLTHTLCDFAYHTGQASILRKLIAAQRKRLRK